MGSGGLNGFNEVVSLAANRGEPDRGGASAEYWNAIADRYDRLYQGEWSRNEDLLLEARLRAATVDLDLGSCTVVDIGCGTGLGFSLVEQICGQPARHLVGIDVSDAMLDRCRSRHPDAVLLLGDAEGRIEDFPQQIDLCLLLSVSGSYLSSLPNVLLGLRSKLSTGGIVYLSVLSRWSLRRMVRFRFGRTELYRTRGDLTSETPPVVTTYTRADIKRLATSTGYAIRSSHGGSPLAGVAEGTSLWKLGQGMARLVPWACHSSDYVLAVEP